MSYGIYELPFTGEQLQQAISNSLNRNFNQAIPVPVAPGDTVVVANFSAVTGTATTMTATALSITIPKDGTYRLKWNLISARNSATYYQETQLYKNGAIVGTLLRLTPSATINSVNYTLDLDCLAGDVIAVGLDAYSSSYPAMSNYLVACIAGDIGFAG